MLFQTIGRDNYRQAFYEMFDSLAVDLRPAHPELSEAEWADLAGTVAGGLHHTPESTTE